MRRPRRPSIPQLLIELLFRLVFGIGMLLVRLIILLRRLLPAPLLLLIVALVPLIIIFFDQRDNYLNWLILAAALGLAFAAGSLKSRP